MTNSTLWLKTGLMIFIVFLLSVACLLWLKVPELFEYFNQAFCAH